MIKRIVLAFQFLTIIPVKDVGKVSEEKMGSATAFFPLIGIVEGLMLAISAILFLKIVPVEVTNALLVFLLVIINGGLRLDGLADTFDAIASRGDREKKHSIMKDSSIGPTGVIAIVMALLLKYVLLNAIYFHSGTALFFSALIIMPLVSRWSMVPAAYYCKSAGHDGLGRMFIENTGAGELLTATALAVAFALVICGFSAQYLFFTFYVMFVLPVLFMFSWSAVWFFRKNFGGMSGDSFGALNELAVLIFLMTSVIWLQKFI